MHRIENEIPDAEYLHLPPILKELIMEKPGLILFVGATSKCILHAVTDADFLNN